jgi:outer membrane lipoprotein-sorting protein
MKRFILALSGLLVISMLNAQTLEEIVKKYTAANKLDNLSAFKTIKITAKMSMSGNGMNMDMDMEMWMKNPNKIKTVASFSGQQMIAAFDGVKGYSINPMTGGEPVEMTADQIKQTQDNNMFQNKMLDYFKKGQLHLEGDENVDNKPAFKIKADLEGGNTMYMFIDKSTYFQVKTTATVNQNGQVMTVDVFPSDYKEMNGIILPGKTTTSAQGMDIIMTFDKVEVNIPMDDSIFKLK